MRVSYLEDDLGMDLDDEEGSLDDSLDPDRSLASDSLHLEDDSELQLPANETVSVNSDDSLNEIPLED